MKRLIFDSHLDLAWNALSWKRDLRINVQQLNRSEAHIQEAGRGKATTCLPEMRQGRIGVCLGTLMGRVPYGENQLHGSSLDFPSHENVFGFCYGQLGYYRVLQEVGEARLIATATELKQHVDQWVADDDSNSPIGIIVAMEGCDGIIVPSQATKWFELGLRVASLVHYGTSAYAVGTGEDGPITKMGRELLEEFSRVGIILDVTHLSDTSFFDVLDCYGGPLLASHQNCRALVDHQRQFSDKQINGVIDRKGILGVAMDAWMLYPGGWIRGETNRSVVGLDAVVDHIDHICQLAGNINHVAIGSDLDGGFGTEQTPTGLDSIADLQKIGGILTERGYSDSDINKVFYENWFNFFLEHLPE